MRLIISKETDTAGAQRIQFLATKDHKDLMAGFCALCGPSWLMGFLGLPDGISGWAVMLNGPHYAHVNLTRAVRDNRPYLFKLSFLNL